jgi:MoxR-like ATPase
VVVGKDRVLMWVFAAILAKGHILLEDLPGVGKTTMAVAFSKSLQLQYNRMQFTPDVLPSDVTGYSVLDPKDGSLTYRPGSVLCNLFLADELNRATSRTQAALLEAMEEGQVTVDGITHKLPAPFVVIATQNPTGAAGTQLLPDSQLDRFAVRLRMGYPELKDEMAMVENRQGRDPMEDVQPLTDIAQLLQLQETVEKTFVAKEVIRYVVELINATRNDPLILQGASPRATLCVVAMAKAIARLRGRDYVTPKDVQEVFLPTVAHRLILSAESLGHSMTQEQVLTKLLRSVSAPRLG